MQASRLLSLLMLLQARGRMSAPALAAALEVSERTILRDIEQLSAAGIPVWGERGRYGGFQLRTGWTTQLTGLTEPEVNALFLAGLPGPAAELGVTSAAASARLKVIAGLPPQWREQAERVTQRLHIDPDDWYRSHETPAFLRDVVDCVWNGWRLHMRYQSWRGLSASEVNPLGVVIKAGAWYLVAESITSPQRKSTYRLANIQSLHTNKQSFKRPKDFALASYWQAHAARFEAELNRVQALIRVSPRARIWLENLRIKTTANNSDTPQKTTPPSSDAWTEHWIFIESVEHGCRQLLALGAHIEVLSPPELRAAMRDEARAISQHYVVP